MLGQSIYVRMSGIVVLRIMVPEREISRPEYCHGRNRSARLKAHRGRHNDHDVTRRDWRAIAESELLYLGQLSSSVAAGPMII